MKDSILISHYPSESLNMALILGVGGWGNHKGAEV